MGFEKAAQATGYIYYSALTSLKSLKMLHPLAGVGVGGVLGD
jgi:hypothetical protein